MSTKTIRHTAILALLALTGSTYAVDSFQSAADNAWSNTATWLMWDAGQGKFIAATRVPAAGDTVEVAHNVSVGASAACATLTVDSGKALTVGAFTLTVSSNATFAGSLAFSGAGTLDISGAAITVPSGGVVTIPSGAGVAIAGTSSITVVSGGSFTVASGGQVSLSGTAPNLTVVGVLSLNGLLRIDASSGTPFVRIDTTQDMPASNTGRIQGVLHNTGNRPELRLHSGVTLTNNNGTLDGDLKIMGTANGNGTFTNSGTVDANIGAEILLDSTLAGIADDSSAAWKANANGGIIRFDEANASMAGSFQLLVTGCILRFNANISTPPLVVDHGRIDVVSGTFTVGTVTGSCAGKPASSSSFTAAGSPYNYCNP